MAYLLDRIKKQLSETNLEPRSNAYRRWLTTKISNLQVTRQALLQDKERLRNTTFIGRMYFYYYDPKLKDMLPYYDRFPLVIPIEQHSDGFLGLNLHYIDPKQRIILLDKLSEFATNSAYDETTRLRMSYSMLKKASRVYEKKPCLKKYLYKHIDSRFLEISADEWDIAAMLPVESFVGASSSKVWAESRKKY
jgi:hypothetical protein